MAGVLSRQRTNKKEDGKEETRWNSSSGRRKRKRVLFNRINFFPLGWTGPTEAAFFPFIFLFFFNFLLRKRRRKAKRLFSIFLLSTSRACLWGRRRVIQYNGKVDVKKLDEKMRKEVKLHSFTGRRRRRLRTRRINKVRQDNFFLFLTPPPFVVKMSLRNLGDGFSPMSAAVPVSHLSVASL